AVGPDHLDVEVAGVRRRARVLSGGDGAVQVDLDGRRVSLAEVPRLPTGRRELPHGATLAPMPGTVSDVAVAVDDVVAEGQRLVTLEAMKMEHRVTAAVAGTVTEVAVEPGQQVDAEQVLVIVAPHDGAAA
ncbi:MAG: acetyl-CoA carboxylase biotin carboxyl carrier protein subunit, partial [Nitriliruptoraceae bacterium]